MTISDSPASPPESAQPSRPFRLGGRSLDVTAVIAVIVIYLVVQRLLIPGPDIYDPTLYIQDALTWPHIPADYWVLRIGLMFPVKVAVHFFGPSRFVLFGLPLIATSALAAACYGIMRILFDDRVIAIGAALVVVLNQDALLNTSLLFPDPTSTAIFAVGIFAILVARRDGRLGNRSGLAVGFLAGLLLGWTYLVREFSPMLVFAVIAALVFAKYPWQRWAAVIAGAVLMFGVELLYGKHYYGDALERIHILQKQENMPTSGSRLAEWAPLRHDVHNIFQAFWVFPHLLLAWHTGFLMFALLVVFLASAIYFHDRRFAMLAIWFLSVVLIMGIITVIRKPGNDPAVEVGNIRYWYQAMPAMIMGGIGGIGLLTMGRNPSARRKRAGQSVVALVAAVLIVPGAVEYHHCATTGEGIGHGSSGPAWNQYSSFMASPQAKTYTLLYAEHVTARAAKIYNRSDFGHLNWDGRIQKYPSNSLGVPTTVPDSLLLINNQRTVRRVAKKLLLHWDPVWVSSDSSLALLTPRISASPQVAAKQQALSDRWIAHFQQPKFVAGHCGNSPYAATSF